MRKVSFGVKLTAVVTSLVLLGTISLSIFAILRIRDFMSAQIGLRAESLAIASSGLFGARASDGLSAEDISSVTTHLQGITSNNDVLTILLLDTTNAGHVSLLWDAKPDYLKVSTGSTWDVGGSPVYSMRDPGFSAVQMSVEEIPMVGWSPVRDGSGEQIALVVSIINLHDLYMFVQQLSALLYIFAFLLTVLAGFSAYKFASVFEKAAVTDGLMKIYNHKFFKQRLEQEVARARRYRHPLSLVLMDLDFFKKVNDTYGHAIGDLVLREMAKLVVSTSRKTDVVCRYGGEEVVVILPHTQLQGAREFAERLRERVEDYVVKDPEEDVALSMTVSIGVAMYESGLDMMDLIKRADAALYHSKRTGRNRVSLYDPEYDLIPSEAKRVQEPPPHPLRRKEDLPEFPQIEETTEPKEEPKE